jgi:hypothetical protein
VVGEVTQVVVGVLGFGLSALAIIYNVNSILDPYNASWITLNKNMINYCYFWSNRSKSIQRFKEI